MNPPYKAVLVDDEPAARRLLRTLLAEHEAWIEIIGEAASGAEAVALINESRPDVVFLDIQLQDLTGFEVIEKLSFVPNIIFITAYEQYAIQAFESFSVDYLLKPVRTERLAQSLQKLRQFGKRSFVPDRNKLNEMSRQWGALRKPTAFPVKTGDKIILLRFENISHFEAADKYVFVFTTEGQKYLLDQTLTVLEEKLPENFIRVQKSFILNRDKVAEIHKHFNGRFIIVLHDKKATRITTGQTYAEKIKETFGL